MIRFTSAAFAAFLLSASATWADGPVYPPPPQAAPSCSGGNSVIGYNTAGAALVCGTALSTGSIATGTNQLGVYTGSTAIGPLTPGGDVAFSNPNFSVNSLRGGNITVPNVTDTVDLLSQAQTLTNKTISGANNTLSVRANLDLTGTLAATNFPAMTGDVTSSAGSLATTISNGAVSATKMATGAAATNIGALSGGDLTGNLPGATVTGLSGRPISAIAPTVGQALVWNGTTWSPSGVTGGGGGASTLTGDVVGSGSGTIGTSVVGIGGQSVLLAHPFSTTGTGSINLAATGSTSVTLPSSGTLLTNAAPTGSVLVGNALGIATPVAPSGDISSVASNGTVTLSTVTSAGSCTNCSMTYDAKGRVLTTATGVGGSGGASPALPVGSIQVNANGSSFASLVPSTAFTTSNGALDIAPMGGALTGNMPNPGLNASAVVSAMGVPQGDLGGASYTTPKVVGLQGFPIATATPTPSSQLVWNGNQYVPTVLAPGMNQLQGDVIAGPGSSLQTATINPGVVSNAKLASAPALSIKANPTNTPAAEMDVPIGSTLQFANNILQIAPTGITSQCIPVNGATSSLTISATGQVISYIPGVTCPSTGNHILADNGTDKLAADDVITDLLLADAGSGLTPCALNLGLSYNTGCNFISQTMLGIF